MTSFRKEMRSILSVGGIVVFLSGLGIFGWQIYGWLKYGTWVELPLILGVQYIPEGYAIKSWFNHPDSWLGLHRLLVWALETTPITVVLILGGLYFALRMSEDPLREHKRRREANSF